MLDLAELFLNDFGLRRVVHVIQRILDLAKFVFQLMLNLAELLFSVFRTSRTLIHLILDAT